MPDILLKDVDQDVYDRLRSKAAARGLDLSELLLDRALNDVLETMYPTDEWDPADRLDVTDVRKALDQELAPPPEDRADPLAAIDRDDEAFRWLLAFRRKHWQGLWTQAEYEDFVEATKRKDVGRPSVYDGTEQ